MANRSEIQKRRFSDVAGRDQPAPEQSAVAQALNRLAHTADGMMLEEYLLYHLSRVTERDDSPSACDQLNAERRFARNILLMMKGEPDAAGERAKRK